MKKDTILNILTLKDLNFITKVLVKFIKDEITKAGFEKAVIGISGGVDSALSAFLTVKALGKENVTLISMPYKLSSESSKSDAKLVARVLGAEFYEIDITPQIDVYYERFGSEVSRLRMGNKMARERMAILYDFAAYKKALVVGTSNKSELLIGYSTRWGDNANDINPLGDVYKTQVWELSKFLGVPEKIINKKPSADLWPGQTDEKEIGLTYHLLDQILVAYVDLKFGKSAIIDLGYNEEIVGKVLTMIKRSQYKRKLPIICKIATRTVDKDFLYLRDWGM